MKWILTVAAVALLAGCTQSGYQTLPVDEWKTQLDATPHAFLLDVRTPEEYQAAHIHNATLVPYDVLRQNTDQLPTDKDTPIFVYCRSGNRSAIASETLTDLGYTDVRNMAGGINDWIANGHPVEAS